MVLSGHISDAVIGRSVADPSCRIVVVGCAVEPRSGVWDERAVGLGPERGCSGKRGGAFEQSFSRLAGRESFGDGLEGVGAALATGVGEVNRFLGRWGRRRSRRMYGFPSFPFLFPSFPLGLCLGSA